MQIHEIARRPVDEGILKGVANNVVKPVVNNVVKPVAKLPLNTAEYFANKILDKAGVPAAQQGQYSKYGHMAASQNKGTASIAKAENDIATEIAKEWARLGTINAIKDETLDPRNITQAATKLNTGKLQINTDNIVATVKKMAPEQRRLQDLYKKTMDWYFVALTDQDIPRQVNVNFDDLRHQPDLFSQGVALSAPIV